MMLKYILLGVIQGITEFFPVSSSAHLLIFQKLMGMTGNALVISVVLHLGTGTALLIFFFKDILNLLCNIRLLLLVIMATIITGIIGISGREFFESLFSSLKVAIMALAFTGTILILTKKFMNTRRSILRIKDAFTFGLMQGLSIIPGISRSGVTISTLLFRGIERETCFRFSFLASIPAVFGAAILEAKNITFSAKIELKNFVAGFFFSLLMGILSLGILKIILRKAKLHYFGYYCILLAIIAALFIR